MKILRTLVIVVGLAGLAVSQFPAKAACQMSLGYSRLFCAMACCKQATTAAKCPQIRTAPAKDLITPSEARFHAVTQTLAWMFTGIVLAKPQRSYNRPHPVMSIKEILLQVTPAVRAPPTDFILFSA